MLNETNGPAGLLAKLIASLGHLQSQDLPPGVEYLLRNGRADDVLRLAYERLHAYPFKDVPLTWRRAYEEAAVAKAVLILQNAPGLDHAGADCSQDAKGAWMDDVVRALDMAIIMAGAPLKKDCIESFYRLLSGGDLPRPWDDTRTSDADSLESAGGRPPKRRRVLAARSEHVPSTWPMGDLRHPRCQNPVKKMDRPSLLQFQQHLDASGGHEHGSEPVHITGSIEHWPALDPACAHRNWRDPHYLLSRTAGGRRLVPVEIGRSYTDEAWTQKIVSIGEFVQLHMLNAETEGASPEARAYLAQYDIFAHVPELRNDIAIPDYCYATPPPGRHIDDEGHKYGRSGRETPDELDPQLNAWFGPAGTVSPAHTDPHHNILAQVVGYKYLRLFAPSETPRMYPRGVGEDGVDMSNTSQVDVGAAMKTLQGWDWHDGVDEADERGMTERFPLFKKAAYVEAVLGPGHCIYIPRGWWHYVRSLSTSFSVSFWWD